MPKTAEELKVYRKEYRALNREKIAKQRKEYCASNREKVAKKKKEWDNHNKEELVKKHKEYYDSHKVERKEWEQTPVGKKSSRISNLKKIGLLCDDMDTLYEKYLNTSNCENCDVILTVDRYITSTTRCMDHCHETGLFRNVLCHACNIKRG